MTEYQVKRPLQTAPVHPGELMREVLLEQVKVPVAKAARAMGITRPALYAVLNGTGRVTADMALLFCKLTGAVPDLFLHMPVSYTHLDVYKRQTLSSRAPLKGLTVAAFGLMLAMIGSGSQAGTLRWTFGSLYLWDGLPLIPVTLGIFAVPELADMAIERRRISGEGGGRITLSSQWQGVRDVWRHRGLILRCSALGTALGTIPGIGSAVIDWIVYGYAQRTERNAESFGTGDVRGVIAPESANNAKEGGHLVPTIAFGVPAGASMTLLLGAFLMHGICV